MSFRSVYVHESGYCTAPALVWTPVQVSSTLLAVVRLNASVLSGLPPLQPRLQPLEKLGFEFTQRDIVRDHDPVGLDFDDGFVSFLEFVSSRSYCYCSDVCLRFLQTSAMSGVKGARVRGDVGGVLDVFFFAGFDDIRLGFELGQIRGRPPVDGEALVEVVDQHGAGEHEAGAEEDEGAQPPAELGEAVGGCGEERGGAGGWVDGFGDAHEGACCADGEGAGEPAVGLEGGRREEEEGFGDGDADDGGDEVAED